MPPSSASFLRAHAGRSIVAVTALSMFATFGTATLIAPSAPHYAIVNAAAVDPNSDTVGISDNNLLFSATDPAVIAKHLDEMQALGIQDIRIAVPWATTEPANGQYNWTAIDNMVNAADARGMGILGVVNTTPDWARAAGTGYYTPPTNAADYGDFMGALASRYAGKMSDFEVWNEPNAYIGYSPAPDPSGYTALLKAAYPAIKAANPSATVIGGVLGSTVTWGNYTLNPVDFVQQMYADGAAGYFDALSFHPYQNTTEFSQGANLANSPLNQVTDIHQLMVANGDGTKQIWSSEYGLPTGIVGDQQQADYISDFLDNWSTLSYAGPAFLYTLQDTNSADTTDPEATFGVYTDTWTPKLAAQVISDFIAQHGTPSAMKLAAATAATAVADQSALPTTASPALAMDTAAQTVAETVGTAMQNYVQAISDAIASGAADAADQAAAQSDTVATDQTAATQAPTTDAARTEPATTDPSATSPAATTSTTDTTAATTAPTTATAPTAATTDAARTATSTADPTPPTSATTAAATDPGTTETPETTAVPTTQSPAETATTPSVATTPSAEATTPTTDSVDPTTADPTTTTPATAKPAPSVGAAQGATATADAASTGDGASTGNAADRTATTG